MVKNSLMLATAAAALIAALSGCGSSNSTTGSSAAATSAPASSTASSAASGYGGRYGSGGTSSTAGSTAAALTVTVKHDKLGTVLAAGPKHLTVYLFEADHAGASACTGECAGIWPPVTTQGSAVAGAGAQASDISTITRADGSKQVTYKGHPLYYYVKDKDNGDSYGQGIKAFGAAWYVLSPAGSKIDPS